MRHANALLSYNARASRMRMRGLSKSTNRTSRLIYGFCKPCTVIGLSKRWSKAKRRTKCEIIQERQIELRRACISSRLDLKISSTAIIISTWDVSKSAYFLSRSLNVSIIFSYTCIWNSFVSSFYWTVLRITRSELYSIQITRQKIWRFVNIHSSFI